MVFTLYLATEVVNADFVFGTPTNLGPTVNSSSSDQTPRISSDGLELYFCSGRPGGYSNRDIWIARRLTASDPWGEPVNLGPRVNKSASERGPSISADGLSLYYDSPRSGGYGGSWGDIWVTTRATKDDAWGAPVNLGSTVNSSYQDVGSSISADGLSLFFSSNRPGGYGQTDIWVTTRATTNEPWSEPVNLGPTVNSSASEISPRISGDGRTLFFSDYESGPFRPGGYGGSDIWVTMRATVSDPWSKPVNLGPTLNSSALEGHPAISADGSTIFFMSVRPGGLGGHDLWQAPIIPIVDFNGDGIVDAADMCIMIENWGSNYSLCDIGPTPFGDGIVDVQDLIVLSEHLFEEVIDPTLLAHWSLDEAQGIIASDSAGERDGTLHGDPLWLSEGGMIDGALAFDGIEDYVSTDSVLNPAANVFSVVAWIKGGAPGQVIISQEGGANWLMADIVDGALRTNLRTPATGGRDPKPPGPPLICTTVVTDGDWHRVSFIMNGSDRILYVDGIVLASDTAEILESAGGGLYIGAGSSLETDSFWSGLIDDVRIYNRALHP